ncbi:MAG: M23 family metallopeptidase [Bradymonadia bacterium]|jgi:murein DD-endopeptidase MepM/ murein hydrolase activator NlpD
MSKAPLQFHNSATKRRPAWIVLAIFAAVVAIIVFVTWPHGKDDIPESAPHIEAFGMPDWREAELIRQVLPEQEQESSNELEQVEDPFLIKGRVSRNQTLFVALKNKGLDPKDIHPLIASMSKVFDFKRSKPGDHYEIVIDEDRKVLKFSYNASAEEQYVAHFDGQTYISEKVEIQTRTETEVFEGVLQSSLFNAFTQLGESGELATHFMRLFIYDIDFGSQAQAGDRFQIMVDKTYLDGKFYKYGRVWAARYQRSDGSQDLQAFYFDDEKEGGFYTPSGQALKRTFLKAPVLGCVITSPYNLKRMHPILKRVRPHYGVDWAGPTGTPIMAIADGVVSFAAWKGGNGYLLVIEHERGYTSYSAHLKGFAAGIKRGSRVKQGQTVAYLGNTGISTGPHLHFGLKKNGKYIDPLSIDSKASHVLSGAALARFETQMATYIAALQTTKELKENTRIHALLKEKLIPLGRQQNRIEALNDEL